MPLYKPSRLESIFTDGAYETSDGGKCGDARCGGENCGERYCGGEKNGDGCGEALLYLNKRKEKR
jgi:hypothetical protein